MKVKTLYISYGLAVIVGIIMGVTFCNWSYFDLKKEIQLDSVFSLVITSIIGIYIAKTIQKQHSSLRNEKEFFISELKDFKKQLEKLYHFADENQFPFNDTKNTFKELNQSLQLISGLISESKNCKGVDFSNLIQQIRHLRRYITSKSPDTNSNIVLPISEKIWVEQELTTVKKSLYKIILTVNE